MGDPTREPRPFAPPDHSGPGGTLDPRTPHAAGDRVAWVAQVANDERRPRRLRGRTIDHLGTVTETVGHLVTLELDSGGTVTRPASEVHPRPGR